MLPGCSHLSEHQADKHRVARFQSDSPICRTPVRPIISSRDSMPIIIPSAYSTRHRVRVHRMQAQEASRYLRPERCQAESSGRISTISSISVLVTVSSRDSPLKERKSVSARSIVQLLPILRPIPLSVLRAYRLLELQEERRPEEPSNRISINCSVHHVAQSKE